MDYKTIKKLFLLFACTICICYSSFSQDKEGQGTLSLHTLSHKGIEYTYYLYMPPGLPDNSPLVIVYHGYGANKFPATVFGFNPVADKNGFAVCYPVGPEDFKEQHCWAVGYSFHLEAKWHRDDIGFTRKLVRHLQKEHKISKQNVFATGHSNGGEMSYLLAYEAPDVFAAVAPISGLTMEWMYRNLNARKTIPLLEIHGTEDMVSKWEGDPHNKDGWGEYLAVPQAVNFWAAANRCTHVQRDTLPVLRNKVVAHRYQDGTDNTQVWLYEVIGGTHAWPDKDMDTAAEIWKFFSMYLK